MRLRLNVPDISTEEVRTLHAKAQFLAKRIIRAQRLQFFSSGTAALAEVIRIRTRVHDHPQPRFLVSAYSCPDLIAAIIRGGAEPVLADLQADSLDIKIESCPCDLASLTGVILSNLYGIPEPLSPWLDNRIAVIDDASQSALALDNGEPVGVRSGTAYGVWSFGRGKALRGVGGGLASINGLATSPDASPFLSASSFDSVSYAASTMIRGVLSGFSGSVLSHPNLYAMLTKISGLGIGETHYRGDFSEHPIDFVGLLYAICQLLRLNQLREEAVAAREMWLQLFERVPGVLPIKSSCPNAIIVGVRFAVLCESTGRRSELLERLREFGASESYPKTLDQYEELKGRCLVGSVPGASSLSARILTLPCHQALSAKEREKISKLLY